MAGQLTIDTLKASSGVLATQNGMTGIAKAWVNFNGSSAAINNSFNVGSITKNGTGDYTVNFTTAMVNANYCTQGFSWASAKNASPIILGGKASSTNPQTTSAVQVTTHDNFSESVLYDATIVCVAVFGS